MDRAAALAWLAEDPDPATRAALTRLLATADAGDAASAAELADAFDGRLAFGTAGLRGALGPGPNRMNRTVVRQAAAGLAAYVRESGGQAIAIGFDARHQSDAFARESAAVFAGAGLQALMLPRPLPTPVLAYAVRHLGCAAGVMVTASHNPASDNGYKVYLADGSQIVPPADAAISAQIERIAALPLGLIPLADHWQTLGEEVLQDYVAQAAALVPAGPRRHARVVHTPMHGVGGDVFARVLRAAGFPEPIVVAEQFEPDPDFPTVAFPNPEEPGAMDLALAAARQADADLVIAHDPDADRCAVGIRGEGGHDWRVLTGDEVGSLLGWFLTQSRAADATGVLAQSIVSGTMLASIARAAGLDYAQTLTGFKWISRVPNLRFGYEEALGYCVDPAHVRDKDGITAGLLVVDLASRLLDQGRTLADALDDLDRAHGVHATAQVSRRLPSPALIGELMARLRTSPPGALAGIPVERIDDLELGVDGLPATDGIRLNLAQGCRVIVRPSGTEPKVKCYLQVIEPVLPGDDLVQARIAAQRRLDRLRVDVEALLAPVPG